MDFDLIIYGIWSNCFTDQMNFQFAAAKSKQSMSCNKLPWKIILDHDRLLSQNTFLNA